MCYNFFIESLSQGKDPAVSWAELPWDVMVHILLMKDPSVHNLTSLLWRHRKEWDRIGEKGVRLTALMSSPGYLQGGF